MDDDEDIRTILGELLPTWGYPVITAADGFDAMARAREVTPSAIVLDLWMPKVNGFLFRQ